MSTVLPHGVWDRETRDVPGTESGTAQKTQISSRVPGGNVSMLLSQRSHPSHSQERNVASAHRTQELNQRLLNRWRSGCVFPKGEGYTGSYEAPRFSPKVYTCTTNQHATVLKNWKLPLMGRTLVLGTNHLELKSTYSFSTVQD